MELIGNIPDRHAIIQHFRYPGLVCVGDILDGPFIAMGGGVLLCLEGACVGTEKSAVLREMDFESASFLVPVIARMPQGDAGIQNVLTGAGPTLIAGFAGMMKQEHRYSAAAK